VFLSSEKSLKSKENTCSKLGEAVESSISKNRDYERINSNNPQIKVSSPKIN